MSQPTPQDWAARLCANFPHLTVADDHLCGPVSETLLRNLAETHDLTLAEAEEAIDDLLTFAPMTDTQIEAAA